jgi:hypothetical protein
MSLSLSQCNFLIYYPFSPSQHVSASVGHPQVLVNCHTVLNYYFFWLHCIFFADTHYNCSYKIICLISSLKIFLKLHFLKFFVFKTFILIYSRPFLGRCPFFSACVILILKTFLKTKLNKLFYKNNCSVCDRKNTV